MLRKYNIFGIITVFIMLLCYFFRTHNPLPHIKNNKDICLNYKSLQFAGNVVKTSINYQNKNTFSAFVRITQDSLLESSNWYVDNPQLSIHKGDSISKKENTLAIELFRDGELIDTLEREGFDCNFWDKFASEKYN